MPPNAALYGYLIQTADITDDIHACVPNSPVQSALALWFLRERGVFPRQVKWGQPAATALAVALGCAGDMQFEVIQKLGDSPSVYFECERNEATSSGIDGH